ncbi:hypothetical protein J7297_02541 [Nakaseomyces glabratus]|nr:hypothetical protein J7296_03907 [Nakaseomyces glabratus]KAH7585579.1 hypothetical protein J7298_02544 [Nakaseomyces glabratus]KAH7587267.1 hypothetical protein J7297_02541 [Nakaseomyces glabratus]KAH7599211.1 hypothetical protein J7295_02551 [Nakaseomyces glabratus]KAH7612624.1 hypothetical protein J7292_02528 [Nakaseomyces glabratus]
MRPVPRSLLLKQRKRLQRVITDTQGKSNKNILLSSLSDVFQPINPIARSDVDPLSQPDKFSLFSKRQILEQSSQFDHFVDSTNLRDVSNFKIAFSTLYNNRLGSKKHEWATLEYATILHNNSDWKHIPTIMKQLIYYHAYGDYGPRNSRSLVLNENPRYKTKWVNPLTSSIFIYSSLIAIWALSM